MSAPGGRIDPEHEEESLHTLATILPDAFDEETARGARRVLQLWKDDDGTFGFGEGCDEFFGVSLTADEVRRFALWLLEWIGNGAQPAEPVEGVEP